MQKEKSGCFQQIVISSDISRHFHNSKYFWYEITDTGWQYLSRFVQKKIQLLNRAPRTDEKQLLEDTIP